jgi:hypothetical protein
MGVGGLHELELAGSLLLSPCFTSSPKTAEAVFIMSDVELSGPTHDFCCRGERRNVQLVACVTFGRRGAPSVADETVGLQGDKLAMGLA